MNENISCYHLVSSLIMATSFFVEYFNTAVERVLKLDPVAVLDSSLGHCCLALWPWARHFTLLSLFAPHKKNNAAVMKLFRRSVGVRSSVFSALWQMLDKCWLYQEVDKGSRAVLRTFSYPEVSSGSFCSLPFPRLWAFSGYIHPGVLPKHGGSVQTW